MALIKCAECGREISDRAGACVHCGCPVSFSKPKQTDQGTVPPKAPTDNRGNVTVDDFINKIFTESDQDIPTVAIEATLARSQTGSTTVSVFVPEFNRRVNVLIPNNMTEGKTVRMTAELNLAVNGINRPLKVCVAKIRYQDVPTTNPQPSSSRALQSAPIRTPQPAPARTPQPAPISVADLQTKIKALKRRVYIVPIIRLFFSVYFVLSFAGLFYVMNLFPDGGAPDFLMNIIGIGFSLGFLVTFYFTFLPYIVGFYPDPGLLKVHKIMRNLEKRNLLEKAVTEMETCTLVPFGNKMYLSDHFLFSKKKNGVIIPCDELLWVYESVSHRKGACYLMLGTENWGIQCYSRILGRKQCKQIAAAAIQALQKRNPSIMVGETRENKKKYFQYIKS